MFSDPPQQSLAGGDDGSDGGADPTQPQPPSPFVQVQLRRLRDLLAYNGGVPTRQFALALNSARLPAADEARLVSELELSGWRRLDPALLTSEDAAFVRVRRLA